MGVLKADPTGADAYVTKSINFPSEFWITVRLDFPPAALAAWTVPDDTGYSGEFIYAPVSGTAINLDVDSFFSGPEWFGDIAGSDTPAPVADTWQLIEFHYKTGFPREWYVDGTLVTNALASGAAPGVVDLTIGQLFGTDFPGIAYFDDLTVGTTRGGTELFGDDFEGDLSAWDSTSGAVSIVADPLAPAEVVDPVGICVAFDDATLEPAPTWTRIDDPAGYRFATSYSISRGRQSELDKTGTGTATVNLIDKEGLLDPTNPGSPFAGTIDPMKQAAIALHNPVTDTWHTIFRGFVSDWFYDVDTTGNFTTIRLELADAFDLLAALEMTPGHHGDTPPTQSLGDIYFDQTVGPTPGPFQRISKILDDAGWPEGLRFVLTGNIQLQGTVYERRDQTLAALFDTADAEFPGVGNVYTDKIGRIAFRGRYSRFNPSDPDWQIDFFNCGGRPQADADPENVAPITRLSFRRSKQDILNAVIALPQGVEDTDVPTSLVKDDTSIAKFGWRGESFENLLVYSARDDPDSSVFDINAVDETKLYAQYYVDNYKNPTTRIEKVVFRSRGVENAWAGALWALMTQIDIGDVLHVTTAHNGGGGFDDDYFVEGLHYEVEPKSEEIENGFPDVTLELDLSPRALYGLSPFGSST